MFNCDPVEYDPYAQQDVAGPPEPGMWEREQTFVLQPLFDWTKVDTGWLEQDGCYLFARSTWPDAERRLRPLLAEIGAEVEPLEAADTHFSCERGRPVWHAFFKSSAGMGGWFKGVAGDKDPVAKIYPGE